MFTDVRSTYSSASLEARLKEERVAIVALAKRIIREEKSVCFRELCSCRTVITRGKNVSRLIDSSIMNYIVIQSKCSKTFVVAKRWTGSWRMSFVLSKSSRSLASTLLTRQTHAEPYLDIYRAIPRTLPHQLHNSTRHGASCMYVHMCIGTACSRVLTHAYRTQFAE